MSRIIFICPYLKGGGSTTAQRRFYVKYIATRDGVQKIDESSKLMPATKEQKKKVNEILREFKNSRDIFEYEDYKANPTRANASAFITAAIEQNLHLIATRENYISYIAKRPRAERTGMHGLFTVTGVPVILEQIANEVAEHPGNVWMPIISLRREDATRLGYDNAENWQALLSSYAADIAKHLKIKPDNFRWYAAYHDEGHHPHAQMVCWSTDPSEGFLTKDGIDNIRSGIAGRIFRQELTEIYKQQTQYRDNTAQSAREVMGRLISQMQNGILRNDNIEQLTIHLAHRLQFHTGKKQYGYLKAPLKAVVDEIVNELAKDPRVAEAYRLWCEMRMEVLRTYRKKPPHPGPLSQQKEFNNIRNIIITEATKIIGQEFTFEQPEPADILFTDQDNSETYPDTFIEALPESDVVESEDVAPRVEWNESYRRAKEYLYGSEEMPLSNVHAQYALAKLILTDENTSPDKLAEAVIVMEKAAEAGNGAAVYILAKLYRDGDAVERNIPKTVELFEKVAVDHNNDHAAYQLGKLYLSDDGITKDTDRALYWLTRSAEQGNQYAQYNLGKLCLMSDVLPCDRETALRWFTLSAEQGNMYAQFFIDNMDRWDNLQAFLVASRLLNHMGKIFDDNTPPPASGSVGMTIDRKLLRKLREKKIAQGHAEDDHITHTM